MKFGGKTLTVKNKKKISLERCDGNETQVIELTVTPLPFDFLDLLKSRGAFKNVEPPKGYVELKPGVFKRDPVTNAPVVEPNRNDPTYQRESQLQYRRMQALALREALKNDPTVEYECQEPKPDAPPVEWERYADEMVKEVYDLEKGLTQREVDLVIEASAKLSAVEAQNLTEEAALKTF